MRLMLAIAAAICAWLFAESAARACSCLPPPAPQRAREQADAVFEGRSPAMAEVKDGTRHYLFRVSRIWKGELSDAEEIVTAMSSAACGRNYEPDTTYLIYAERVASGGLRDSICTRTRPVEAAAEDLAALGPWSTPGGRASADDGGTPPAAEPPRISPPSAPPATAPGKRGCAIGSPSRAAPSGVWTLLLAPACRRRRQPLRSRRHVTRSVQSPRAEKRARPRVRAG